jgi:streptogramin lyase
MDALAAASRRVPRRTVGSILPGGCFLARTATPLALASLLAGAVAAAAATSDVASEFPTTFEKPQGIIAGPDGNVWFAEEDGGRVTRLSPGGAVLGSTTLSAGGTPQSLVVGPDGNVWVTEPGVNKIAKLSGSNGSLLGEFAAPGEPEGIAVGPDGNLWFTENTGDKIGKMNTSGTLLAEYAVMPGARPFGITAGPCGDPGLWFTEEEGGRIGKVSTSGTVTEYPVSGSNSNLRGIAAGRTPNCNLYYANRGHGSIGRVTPDGTVIEGFVPLATGSNPIGIVASARGDLWFTENGINVIGRAAAADGALLDEYAIPTPSTFPDGIGLGPSGGATIYFTEAGGNRVGYVNAGGATAGPDLAVSKSVEVSGDAGEQTLLYTLSYTNAGTQASANAVIDEHVPLLTLFAADQSSSGWTCDTPPSYAPLIGGGICHLTLGTLDPGASATATFTVREGGTEIPVPSDFSIYNLASIGGEGLDTDSSNNLADLATPDVGCADNRDPVQYLLCVYHGAAQSTSWFGRVVAKARRVVQQLRLYFQLRDSVFLTSPGGRRYFDTYRAHAPELRALLGSDATLRSLGVAAVGAWETPLQAYFARNGAPTLTQDMHASMTAFLDRLRAVASPGLAAVLNFPRFQSLIGLPLDQYFLTLDRAPCAASETRLCLHGSRFRVETRWRDAHGNTGVGHAKPLTADSGYFWFFTDSNVEVLVKALDGCAGGGHFWVFAGGLTDVQLTMTVTDSVTGQVKDYTNAAGTAFESILDTSAFATCSAVGAPAGSERSNPPALEDLEAPPPDPLLAPALAAACTPSGTTLCLQGGRIKVEATYLSRTAFGNANAVALTPDTGYFWFFNKDNVEVILKALDGCGLNGHRWVFAAGLTDVNVVMTATDTTTGAQTHYQNALGTRFEPVQDTSAFSCP